MVLEAVVNLTFYKNKFLIGYTNGNLIVHDSLDMKHFQNKTMNSSIVMGKNTMLTFKKPLARRTNYYLTSKKQYIPLKIRKKYNGFIPINLSEVNQIPEHVYIIGGAKTLKSLEHKITRYHITITRPKLGMKLSEKNPDTFVTYEFPNYDFKLTSQSEIIDRETHTLQFLEYQVYPERKNEMELTFKNNIQNILLNGTTCLNRTGINTLSVFGSTMKFNLKDYRLPLTTTRNIPFRLIIEELLWILRGETDSKILEAKNVNVWKENTTKEFIKKRGLQYPEGQLGPSYGFSLRHFGGDYNTYLQGLPTGFDQLNYICDLLKNDSYNRRMVINYWDPSKLNQMVLPPCHYTCTFTVTNLNGKKYLNCCLLMRSSDELARSWNCTFYSVLTLLFCYKYNYQPGEFLWIGSNTHIYQTHIEKINETILRPPRPQCVLCFKPEVKDKKIESLEYSDFELVGYFPHEKVELPMAV